MGIDLADYQRKSRAAVMAFWRNRERVGVTGGRNMDGFAALVRDLVRANGLPHAEIYQKGAVPVLPGYFRSTVHWDLLVTDHDRLIAAIQFKSQVGQSIENSFNNPMEEAIGTAKDFWAAYRGEAFGKQQPPLAAWLMLVEDAPRSRTGVRDRSPHFPVFPEFQGASYLQRYDILCQRLVQEQLYTTASIIASPRTAAASGEYQDLSEMTSLKTFVTALAGHFATEAARH